MRLRNYGFAIALLLLAGSAAADDDIVFHLPPGHSVGIIMPLGDRCTRTCTAETPTRVRCRLDRFADGSCIEVRRGTQVYYAGTPGVLFSPVGRH